MVNTDLDFRVTRIRTATVLKLLNLDFDRLHFKAMRRIWRCFTVLRQCQEEMFYKRSVRNCEGHCNA